MNLLRFDMINPLDGLWGQMRHGPMHRFTFRADEPYSGVEIEKTLRRYGIRVWGREMDDPTERALLVKQSQAIWAEYLLCRAGVPLTCPLLDSRNLTCLNQHAAGSMPTPWTVGGIGAHSFVDHVVDWLDRLVG